MIGSRGEQILRRTLPHVDYWNGWFAWNGNTVAGYRPLREHVDRVCRDAGRDPATVRRTMAVDVHMPGSDGAHDPRSSPLTGSSEHIAEALLGFAAEGISHLQVLLSPNTSTAIEQFAPVIALLDKDRH